MAAFACLPDGLDHFAKRQLRAPVYLRYMDDVALFGPSAAALRSWTAECAAWLREHRALEVHPEGGRPVRSTQTFRFLGHVVTRAGARATARTVRRLVARTMASARAARTEGDFVTPERELAAATKSIVL